MTAIRQPAFFFFPIYSIVSVAAEAATNWAGDIRVFFFLFSYHQGLKLLSGFFPFYLSHWRCLYLLSLFEEGGSDLGVL